MVLNQPSLRLIFLILLMKHNGRESIRHTGSLSCLDKKTSDPSFFSHTHPASPTLNLHSVSFLINQELQNSFNNTIATTPTITYFNCNACILYYIKPHSKQDLTTTPKEIQMCLASGRNKALQYYINQGERVLVEVVNLSCS